MGKKGKKSSFQGLCGQLILFRAHSPPLLFGADISVEQSGGSRLMLMMTMVTARGATKF